MALLSGPAVSGAVNDPKSEIAKLVAREKDDRALVREVFMRVLSRSASEKEIDSGFVGVLGAFEVYRGSVRGHRMANLRVILR